MDDLLNLLTNLTKTEDFDRICINLASPDQIRSWSYGEIKTPETINYRTFKPEHEGLFCAQIFGPVKDYECVCGRYKLLKYQGTVCEKCGVEITQAKVRRERMGHIELACPVAHIWYLKSLPSRIGLLLDMSLRDIERILYFEAYVVINPGITSLKPFQLLSEEAYLEALEEYGQEFDARMGGEAIYDLLHSLNLTEMESQLRQQLQTTQSDLLLKRVRKRLKLIQHLRQSGNQPEWMILKVLPVLPPDLRPLVPLEGGRFASSDLNDLYRQVINRNNRIKRLQELNAPDVIVRNEKRMLQEAVDALLDNGRRGRVVTGANKLPLHSLSDLIKGKQGRFRQNLLGKRVDYSGRSVVVVGPTLKLHQCGLPKEMALELFKPFLLNLLQQRGITPTIKIAYEEVENRSPVIWELLQEVIHEHPVLLNRAPTLYRLGIQAFEPVLVEGKAIQLHPLVCKAFNANFGGDQMAIYVPLSLEAQLEARVLMMSSNNILSPANGEPLIVPTQEIVFGLYFLTRALPNMQGEGMIFADINEVHRAYESRVVSLQAQIEVRMLLPTTAKVVDHSEPAPVSNSNYSDNSSYQRITTTVGRTLLIPILPTGFPVELINRELTAQAIFELIEHCYHHFGTKATVVLADQLMAMGFFYATRAGISLNIDDFVIPQQKSQLIAEAFAAVNKVQQQYRDGMITNTQKYQKVIDIWTYYTDTIAQAMMTQLASHSLPNNDEALPQLSSNRSPTDENALHMIIQAGIKNLLQVRQLAGMRGLMAKPDGSIIETPVIANFREGLDAHQYFISTHGTRKGLADTALKTANAGYLTRRLIDVAQDVIITEFDCGTHEGLTLTVLHQGEQLIESLEDRLLGRITAEDVVISGFQPAVIPRGTLLDNSIIEQLQAASVTQIKVRSPLTCQAKIGICTQCYGLDFGRGELVSIGEAVGVVAAQSIGESGTQLTMRTHHTGGVATRQPSINHLKAKFKGIIHFHQLKAIPLSSSPNPHSVIFPLSLSEYQDDATLISQPPRAESDLLITTSHTGELSIVNELGYQQASYPVPYGAILTVHEGETVAIGQIIAYWDPHTYPIITQVSGYVCFVDIIEGITITQQRDEVTGIYRQIIAAPWQKLTHAKDLYPMIKLVDKNGQDLIITGTQLAVAYPLPPGAIINVEEGVKVKAGEVIARVPFNTPKMPDITNSLPRVADLLEARVPKEPAILSRCDGTIRLGKRHKTKQQIIIIDEQGQAEELMIYNWQYLNVVEGQQIAKGEVIVEGELNPHDILELKGIHELAHYLIKELQEIYRCQDVKINDKHFEVIIRQMLRTVTIIDPGNTPFLPGEQLELNQLLKENQKLSGNYNNQRALWKPTLLGITKASLATNSFISAASFIDTTRVLLASSISGQCDELRGFKENVIIGRLIPAGTGFHYHKNR
jgi:DNA-directed RNA polymerase subunit beta'